MQLKAFKAAVRGAAERHFDTAQIRRMFKPLKITANKLKGLAIEGNLNAPSLQVTYREQETSTEQN